LKKFTQEEQEEYQKISDQVNIEVSKEFDELINSSNIELKNTKDKDEKKKIKAEIKVLENKKEEKIKKLIKEKFNYQIAIAEVEKA